MHWPGTESFGESSLGLSVKVQNKPGSKIAVEIHNLAFAFQNSYFSIFIRRPANVFRRSETHTGLWAAEDRRSFVDLSELNSFSIRVSTNGSLSKRRTHTNSFTFLVCVRTKKFGIFKERKNALLVFTFAQAALWLYEQWLSRAPTFSSHFLLIKNLDCLNSIGNDFQ